MFGCLQSVFVKLVHKITILDGHENCIQSLLHEQVQRMERQRGRAESSHVALTQGQTKSKTITTSNAVYSSLIQEVKHMLLRSANIGRRITWVPVARCYGCLKSIEA